MIYQSTEWKEIEETELNDDSIISEFSKDTRRTLYVCRAGALAGVITLGNFRRHFLHKQPLIQREYTSVSSNEEEHAIKILQESDKIFAVPVLDENRHIVKEYRKEFKDMGETTVSAKTLIQVYKQFLPTAEDAQNLIITRFENVSQRKEADKIAEKTSGRLTLIDEADITDIKEFVQNAGYQVVYDCVPEGFRLREIVYKKYDIMHSRISRPEINTGGGYFHEYLLHFESVGIINQEMEYFEPVIDSATQIFDEGKFKWREEKDCYEYLGNLKEVPEVLCVSCCLLKNPCVLYEEHFIPVISMSFPIYEQYVQIYKLRRYAEMRCADYDLACNIIPKLQKNGVKTMIVSNADMEWQKIKDFDKERAGLQEQKTGNAYLAMIKDFLNRQGYGEDFFEEWKKKQVCIKNGYPQIVDISGKYINRIQGERLTVGNPEDYNHTFWLFGACLVRGYFTDDEHTLGSFLRKKVPDSYYIKNVGSIFENRNMIARDSAFHSGDIAIIFAFDNAVYRQTGLEAVSLADVYQQCPDLMEHIIDNLNHIDGYLTERIADKLYDVLEGKNAFLPDQSAEEKDKRMVHFGTGAKVKVPEPLAQWLLYVKENADTVSRQTGAIVMNCNPFTLGHRYLIETACTQVDKLLVFVVEEDRSFFKFKDRFQMVQLGTEDLSNVTVIPSGRYIGSAETIPGYFEKNDNPDVAFDGASDVDIFANIVAPELNIKVRFAGEEPIDRFTRQYNQTMRRMLPEHGIEFVEIPRKESEGKVISASIVRKYMAEKKYDKVKELVMPQIYEYLEKHFFERES